MSALEIIASTIVLLGVIELRIKKLVKDYLKELIPNGGSSMKDQLNRLETRIDEMIMSLLHK